MAVLDFASEDREEEGLKMECMDRRHLGERMAYKHITLNRIVRPIRYSLPLIVYDFHTDHPKPQNNITSK
jgi:hypothetical protein